MHPRGLFFLSQARLREGEQYRGGLFNLEKIMVSLLHETLNVRAVKTWRDPCQSNNPYSKGGHSHIGSLSNHVLSDARQPEVDFSAYSSRRDFE